MPKDKLRVQSNERIDIQDVEFLAQEGIHDNFEQLTDHVLCSDSRTRKWVLSGFAVTNPAGNQVTVTKGKAILAERRAGSIRYGIITTEGDASKTIDITAYASNTYTIYVRFEAVEGDIESRIFWDPSGSGSEYANSIPTRYTANWSMRIELTSPGAEWLDIGTVVQSTMSLTDTREFYFEGSTSGSYASGWSSDGSGSANDRNADRGLYGVTDFQMFTAAVRQCLTDIKGRGLREWYERDIGGMNIGFDAAPVEGHLALGDANFYLWLNANTDPELRFASGDTLTYDRDDNELIFTIGSTDLFIWDLNSFYPETSGLDLGASGKNWEDLYIAGSVYGDLIPGATNDLGSSGSHWDNGYIDNWWVGNNTVAIAGATNAVYPTTAAGLDLGSTVYPWQSMYYRGKAYSYFGWDAGGAGNSDPDLGGNFWRTLRFGPGEVVHYNSDTGLYMDGAQYHYDATRELMHITLDNVSDRIWFTGYIEDGYENFGLTTDYIIVEIWVETTSNTDQGDTIEGRLEWEAKTEHNGTVITTANLDVSHNVTTDYTTYHLHKLTYRCDISSITGGPFIFGGQFRLTDVTTAGVAPDIYFVAASIKYRSKHPNPYLAVGDHPAGGYPDQG